MNYMQIALLFIYVLEPAPEKSFNYCVLIAHTIAFQLALLKELTVQYATPFIVFLKT